MRRVRESCYRPANASATALTIPTTQTPAAANPKPRSNRSLTPQIVPTMTTCAPAAKAIAALRAGASDYLFKPINPDLLRAGIARVMVNGRWLFRDNRWQTLDFAQARRDLDAAHARLMERIRS